MMLENTSNPGSGMKESLLLSLRGIERISIFDLVLRLTESDDPCTHSELHSGKEHIEETGVH